MNDTNYLLDESLTKLSEIHKIQDEMSDVNAWNALPQVCHFKNVSGCHALT